MKSNMATLNSMNTKMHSHGDMIILDTGVVGALGGGGEATSIAVSPAEGGLSQPNSA